MYEFYLLQYESIKVTFKIKAKLEAAANKAGILHTNEAMNELLISRVRANMHIVLCMSPIGDAFRNRLRYSVVLKHYSVI